MVLPMPWPTSSRLALCRVRVNESAMRDVSRLSMEPSRARISAGVSELTMKPTSNTGMRRSGRPVGTSPMTLRSVSQKMPMAEPMIMAARGPGRYRLSGGRQSTPTRRVMAATIRACTWALDMASGIALIFAITPPGWASAPTNGATCTSMTMIPMPVMKPEMTEWGV